MFYTKASQARSSATLFKKRFQHRCLPVNITKFLRTFILKNICERLLVFYKLVISKPFLNPFLTFPKSSATFASSLFNSSLSMSAVALLILLPYVVLRRAYTMNFFFHRWLNFSFDGFLSTFNTCIQL